MPDSNVSSCVLNILGSFSSSLGLYKKLRDKRRKKKRARKNEPSDGEELRLSRSLRQGPEDISQEYQQSVYVVGDQFAIGDGMLARKIRTLAWTDMSYSYRSDISGRDITAAERRTYRDHYFVPTQ